MEKLVTPFSVALLALVAGCSLVNPAAQGTRPPIPRIEGAAGWQLSEGCRVYEFGILTDPDCDLLIGEGITIQVTRVRLLTVQPGQDDRPTIGIQLQTDQGDWTFSSPFVALSIAGKIYTPADIDQAVVFGSGERPIFTEKLPSNRQRFELRPGQKMFFRLRFPVPQSELGNGFALQVTGLHNRGGMVRVPIMNFE